MTTNTASSLVKLSDGARLNVKLLGDDDKTKPLLVVLHGAPGVSSLREPEQSFGFLAPRFRVLVYDARGSGDSDSKGPFTHERWTADIDELRKWAGAGQLIIAGGSYGGFIALEYALAYPSRVSAMILRDTWASGFIGAMSCLKSVLTSSRIKPDPERQLRAWTGHLTSNEDLEAALTEILPIYVPEKDIKSTSTESQGGVSAADFEEANTQSTRPTPKFHYETHNFAFDYNQPRYDVRHKLQDIDVPTLVVVGRHDPITPVAFSEEINREIPNSRLHIFEKSGHSPPADEPEAFRAKVLQFIDEWQL